MWIYVKDCKSFKCYDCQEYTYNYHALTCDYSGYIYHRYCNYCVCKYGVDITTLTGYIQPLSESDKIKLNSRICQNKTINVLTTGVLYIKGIAKTD